MNYEQVSNDIVVHKAQDLCSSYDGIVSTRVLEGFLLNEHEREIYSVFEPTKQALSLPVNDRVRKLERYLATLEQVEIGLEHEFIDGLYKRTMRVPAGTVLTGAIHKVKHMDVMTEGSMIVVTEKGTKQIDAPFTMTTQVGIKKCGMALTDVVWCTFHAAPYDTIEEMEAHIHSEGDKDLFIENDDYANFLNEKGITDHLVKSQSEIKIDMIEMPKGYEHIYKAKSNIEGYGLFSDKKIQKNDIICCARVKQNRTIAGRYANHSDSPNARPFIDGENISYIALRSINPGSEITINYRDALKINPIID
ncbi:MAG: SET domain-containing protein-lysine N-methyltransferase [Planctomycetes bacterium]|nr:SET domain-containing protein-lysine N-methyltransferase [Planctomycetota bacterium]